MLYDVTNSPLLPPGLQGNELDEQAAVAERVLGLRGLDVPIFTGGAAADAARAVAMQVGVLDATDPESYIAASVGRAGEQITYLKDTTTGKLVPLHPLSVMIVEQLFAELDGAPIVSDAPTWPTIGPWR